MSRTVNDHRPLSAARARMDCAKAAATGFSLPPTVSPNYGTVRYTFCSAYGVLRAIAVQRGTRREHPVSLLQLHTPSALSTSYGTATSAAAPAPPGSLIGPVTPPQRPATVVVRVAARPARTLDFTFMVFSLL